MLAEFDVPPVDLIREPETDGADPGSPEDREVVTTVHISGPPASMAGPVTAPRPCVGSVNALDDDRYCPRSLIGSFVVEPTCVLPCNAEREERSGRSPAGVDRV